MLPNRFIPSLLGVSAIVCLSATVAVADGERVAEIAQSVTVRIDRNNQPDASGVIVSRQDNTYYVLTALHTFNDSSGRWQIVAPDGQRYSFNAIDLVTLGNYDMALVSFSSSSSYDTAEIASDAVRLGTSIYVAGWLPGEGQGRFTFTPGQVSSFDLQTGGYEIGYTNVTNAGMSGGPVFDENGELVAMHGSADGQALEINGETVRLKEGINWGIPIARFLEGSAEAMAARGRQKLAQGDYRGAMADFNQGLFFNPDSAEALTGRGYAYFARQDYREAIADASDAIDRDSNFSVAYLLRGASYAQRRDYDRAIADYTRAIELRNNFAEAYGLRGVSYAELQQYRPANLDAARAIELSPDNPFAYFRRSEVRDLIGEIEAARADRQRGEELLESFEPTGYQVALLEGGGRDHQIEAAANVPSSSRRDPTPPPVETQRVPAPEPTVARASSGLPKSISHLPQTSLNVEATIEAGENIRALAVSPDGSSIAGGGESGTIYLWDSNGDLVARLTGHESQVESLAFSPNGALLGSGSSDKTARVWDLRSQSLRHTLGNRDSPSALSVTFNPTGQQFIVGRRDGQIEVWDVRTGRLRNSLGGHLGGTTTLAVHPNGRILASSGGDRKIKLWNLANGTVLQTLIGHGELVQSISFDSTGDRLASCDFEGELKIWQTDTGSEIQHGRGGWAAHAVAFGNDDLVAVGLQTASTGTGAIALWDTQTGQYRGVEVGGLRTVRAIAFNPNGSLVSASEDGTVRIWQIP
ncbi:trypsin-like peptidase domain-containing protein [Baaleninema sp.]|uniref:trypsin-like peptidase domain-containing protein n=1 Tax=Baaleninema sp. TaxID=3101197 RepID=UPI003D0752AC